MRPPNNSLERTRPGRGFRAIIGLPGRSARSRYASARRRKTMGWVSLSKGELSCPKIPRRLVMAPRLRRSPFAMQIRPWVNEARESLAGSQGGRRLADGAGRVVKRGGRRLGRRWAG
jgi:hypothetical protein